MKTDENQKRASVISRKEVFTECGWIIIEFLYGLMILGSGCIEHCLKSIFFLVELLGYIFLKSIDITIFHLILQRKNAFLQQVLADLNGDLHKLSKEIFTLME